jgi:hypothetical protein
MLMNTGAAWAVQVSARVVAAASKVKRFFTRMGISPFCLFLFRAIQL